MISTHILDLMAGKPASGVRVTLARFEGDWRVVGTAVTDKNGRVKRVEKRALKPGIYELNFESGSYFRKKRVKCFHPWVTITFETRAGEHYHVPLLISPFGYSTYRGS